MKITKTELEAKNTEIRNLNEKLSQASSREYALQTQLKQAQDEAKTAKGERDSMKWMSDRNAKNAEESTSELEQLHALLDAFPGCPPREVEGEKNDRDSKPDKRTAMTRLASWLVVRGLPMAKVE